MPSGYTHYRFGTVVFSTLPADTRRSVQRFRRLYDVGLHGPDLFYYYNPISQKGAGLLGVKFHKQTGKSFFTRVCRSIRMERSEAASAALYGVLCHYVLDSVMHPFIVQAAKENYVTTLEFETEFDRYLLEMDGRLPADGAKLSGHLHLTDGECETLAKFYPPATGKTVKRALQATALYTRLSATPEGARRKLLETGIHVLVKELEGMVLTEKPNPRCSHLNGQLYELYQQAMDNFPAYLQQMHAHMTYGALLEEEFSAAFG